MRARQPDRADVVERQRRQGGLRGCRGGRSPGCCSSRPRLSAMLGRGRASSPSCPAGLSPSSPSTPRGNGPYRPARRPTRVTGRPRCSRTQLAVLDAVGPDPGGRRRPLPCRAVGPAIGRRSRRPGVGCRRHRPPPSQLAPLDERWAEPTERWADEVDNPHRLGTVQPPLLAAGLPRLARGSSSTSCCRSRTPPSSTRTRSRGPSRPIPRR